ncbi:hypothetical protein ACJX0J_039290, partial [Zea mays]
MHLFLANMLNEICGVKCYFSTFVKGTFGLFKSMHLAYMYSSIMDIIMPLCINAYIYKTKKILVHVDGL